MDLTQGNFLCELSLKLKVHIYLPGVSAASSCLNYILVILLQYQVIDFYCQLSIVKIQEGDQGVLWLYLRACCMKRITAFLAVSFANAFIRNLQYYIIFDKKIYCVNLNFDRNPHSPNYVPDSLFYFVLCRGDWRS